MILTIALGYVFTKSTNSMAWGILIGTLNSFSGAFSGAITV